MDEIKEVKKENISRYIKGGEVERKKGCQMCDRKGERDDKKGVVYMGGEKQREIEKKNKDEKK